MTDQNANKNISGIVQLDIKESLDDLEISNVLSEIDQLEFTNYEKRKKYKPDTIITSKDNIKIYYHIKSLVDIEYFDKIYNGSMQEAKSGNIYMDFIAVAIILLLNLLEHQTSFDKVLSSLRRVPNYIDIISELTKLAHFIQYEALINICYHELEANSILNCQLIDLYTKYNRCMNSLMNNTIDGRKKISKDTPAEFLSECFKMGMSKCKTDEVIWNIIPFYDPSDDELTMFSMVDVTCSKKIVECSKKHHRDVLHINLLGVASPKLIGDFLEKYKNVTDNPGVTKFIHRLLVLILSI